MKVTIELDVPEQVIQEQEAAGVDWKAQARKRVEDKYVASMATEKAGAEQSAIRYPALHEWLQEIKREHASMSDAEKEAAAAEDAELIKNLNAVRA